MTVQDGGAFVSEADHLQIMSTSARNYRPLGTMSHFYYSEIGRADYNSSCRSGGGTNMSSAAAAQSFKKSDIVERWFYTAMAAVMLAIVCAGFLPSIMNASGGALRFRHSRRRTVSCSLPGS